MIVLCAHIPGFLVPEAAKYFSGTGKFGVWLFFVLSAFLLTSKFYRNRFSISEIGRYIVGRTLRIIPLFLLVVCIYWHFGTTGIDTLGDVLKAITFQEGYAHLWTIPVEFKYYMLLPFMAFLMIKTKSAFGNFAACSLTIALVVVHQLAWPFWLTPENSISTRWYIPCFLLGGYAAVSMDAARKFVSPKRATCVGVSAFLLLLAISPGGRNILAGMPFDQWLQNKFLPLSVLWSVFLVFLVDGKGFIGHVLKSRPFKLLGAWSYSIYLIHWLVYAKLAAGHENSFIWLTAAFTVAIMSGAILYYLVEAPIERFRHSFQGCFQLRAAKAA